VAKAAIVIICFLKSVRKGGGGRKRRHTELDEDGVERCFVQRLADARVREWTLRRSSDVELLAGTFCVCADLLYERGVARRRSRLDVEIDPGSGTIMSKEGKRRQTWGTYPSSTAAPNGRVVPEPPKNIFHT
jgi:hypothetical protein